jgi:hypothetical protein
LAAALRARLGEIDLDPKRHRMAGCNTTHATVAPSARPMRGGRNERCDSSERARGCRPASTRAAIPSPTTSTRSA